jgi:hypothetical protein
VTATTVLDGTTTVTTRPLGQVITAGTVLVAATLAAVAITIIVAATVHPLAGAAMVPLGALLFVTLVLRANPSEAGR